MIEYPSIIASSKAPRKSCIAFNKLDGSNFRAKWTKKKGFCLFGTRTQLIDASTPVWGEMINIFLKDSAKQLNELFCKKYPNEREIVVFGEFHGEHSFAGKHVDENHEITIFDILVGHKNSYFINPTDFIKLADIIKIPEVIYTGNLNDEFIQEVRENKFNLKEGVICKGLEKSGAFRGKIWMCKIKTFEYLKRIQTLYKNDWKLYWE